MSPISEPNNHTSKQTKSFVFHFGSHDWCVALTLVTVAPLHTTWLTLFLLITSLANEWKDNGRLFFSRQCDQVSRMESMTVSIWKHGQHLHLLRGRASQRRENFNSDIRPQISVYQRSCSMRWYQDIRKRFASRYVALDKASLIYMSFLLLKSSIINHWMEAILPYSQAENWLNNL